jgi:hypothetical protein
MTIDPRILETARSELTAPQFVAWKLHIDGHSTRAIAYSLDLSRTTITDRLDAAWRTLRKHGIMVTPDGRPYLTTEVEA